MKIAIAPNNHTKNLNVIDKSWNEMKELFLTVKRTDETMEEYINLDKASKDKIKDVGGFIGGDVIPGGKSLANIRNRSCIVLDADNNVPENFREIVREKCDYEYVCYPTHKSTKEHPRFRLVIPFAEGVTVTPTQYEAIARMIATEIGIDWFDDVSFLPTQLMYFCSTPKDSEETSFESDVDYFIDVDEYLNKYTNWEDLSEYSYTKSETEEITSKRNVLVNNPADKQGWVGAYCTVYPIDKAIELEIPGVYEKSGHSDRYTYIKAETTNGLVVFDNKYAYSHHSSDPIHGKMCDSFDLVRLHLYGKLDEIAKKNTSYKKLPSYKKMLEHCKNDEKVCDVFNKVNIEDPDFSYECEDWEEKLKRDPDSGALLDILDNPVYILKNDRNLLGIMFNKLANQVYAFNVPWSRTTDSWKDSDMSQLLVYIAHNYGAFKDKFIYDAFIKVANDRAYHPINDFLLALPEWDGIERLDTLLLIVFNVEDTIYTREVSRKMFVAAVARVFENGIKFDSMPILCGPQGAGKSTFFRKFAKEWFSDSLSLNDIKDKTGAEKIQSFWIIEIGELAGMKKMDIETIKSFASRQDDKYRPSYGRTVEDHPRQCIIVGTTNKETGYLRDITGNRRYWPIKFNEKQLEGRKLLPWDITDDFVNQVWAEALYRYRNGEKLTLSEEAESLAKVAQDDAMESDDREGIVREYLNRKVPDQWDDMSIMDKRLFYEDNGLTRYGVGTVERQIVSNIEIWNECFGKDISQLKKSDSYEISSIMSKITEWEYLGKLTNIKGYGRQRYYVRKPKTEEQKINELMDGFTPIEPKQDSVGGDNETK